MGEEIKVFDVQAENGGTIIQIDTDKGRLFVETYKVMLALNNYIYAAHDKSLQDQGFERIDPNAPPFGLLTPPTN